MNDFHLEEFQTDRNRVRVVMEDGTAGRWFSRLRHTGDDGILDVPDWAIPNDEDRA